MGHITTISGKQLDPQNIDVSQIVIDDIAHALARIVRFNGHQEYGYTVGMHSICCAMLIEKDEFRLEALMHDATEAYLCDVPTPLKQVLQGYQMFEANLDSAIRSKFTLPPTMSAEIAVIDRRMLIAEAWILHPKLWQELGSPEPDLTAMSLINQHLHYGHRNTQSLFMELAGSL